MPNPNRTLALLLLAGAAAVLAGCTTAGRCCPPPACAMTCPPTTPSPAAPRDHALYDGATGRPIRLADFLAKARQADLVAFGELHDHPMGALYERLVLESLTTGPRPIALAMEFLERDQQEAVDAYLAGDMDRETFVKQTKRSPTYDETHGPLVDWAKAHGIPVIAANAPRRLVSGYRKSGEYYEDYLATLSDEERTWLPAETSMLKDAYWEKFEKLMPGMAQNMFRAQSLWDDAMAESIARFRDAHPTYRVMLIVGGFHVESRLGTITKYLQRRPDDKVAVIAMSRAEGDDLGFDAETDEGTADAVLKVTMPEQPRPPSMPNPHAAPTSPGTRPTPTAPPEAGPEA